MMCKIFGWAQLNESDLQNNDKEQQQLAVSGGQSDHMP